MDCYFAWQTWHLWHWAGSGGALGFRRGAGDAAAVGVAGVPLCDIYVHFVWQAWHFVTWIVTLRGKRGTYGTGLALVARLVLGVAPGTPRLLAWQPWHLWHWAGSGGAVGFRRGARNAAAVGVAAVALGDIHLRFTWQAWYLVTSTSTLAWQPWRLWHWAGSGGALGFRRGAGDAAAVGVAAVALGDIHPPSFHVAGAALCDIYLHFVWQAWHFVTWIVTLRVRRGTYGTGLALVARLVLGVAPGTPWLLAWQPWHFVTSTFTLCGRCGTYGTGLALVARLVLGVAPGTPRLLAWQPWHLETSTFVSRGRRGTSWHLPCHHTTCLHTTCPHTTCLHTTCPHTHTTCALVITPLVSSHNLYTHTQLTHTQLVIRPLLITPLVITPLVFTLLVFTLLVHQAPAHRQSQAASVSAVCAGASSVAVVTCQVCGMLAVGLKCHMSWTPTAVKG